MAKITLQFQVKENGIIWPYKQYIWNRQKNDFSAMFLLGKQREVYGHFSGENVMLNVNQTFVCVWFGCYLPFLVCCVPLVSRCLLDALDGAIQC